ncbi:MAG TPA: SGNH/GDSL hydrolase family protein [Actinomycetota bacterium]|nr:SGNH/GDSL hydrolase family protein [Actinomycetota bacterium]
MARTAKILAWLVAAVLISAVSIAVALLVTPTQEVSAVGQTVRVGASAPSLSASGPGELDLFGQHLPTTIQFVGPIRPRLVLAHISVNSQVAALFTPSGAAESKAEVGRALEAGWTRYFVWETVIAGAVGLLLAGTVAGWRRLSWRRTVTLLAAGLLVVEAANLGGVMVTAYSAGSRLRSIGSLNAVVGSAPLPAVPPATAAVPSGTNAVVLGDSTAAGDGNPLVPDPTAEDRACHRSAESYANVLAATNGWQVLNLACSGATIPAGILGPQAVGSVTAPPQLSAAETATNLSAVFVSVGADDLQWSALLVLCASTPECRNDAAVTFFQQQLATFAQQYYRLLQQLAALPGSPRVIVNLYYSPFDTDKTCLNATGLTATKQKAMLGLLDALNTVLAKGAAAASMTAVEPRFTGHALCDPQPYVQGLKDPAPFHPTQAGELAIALADERQLQQPLATPSPSRSG